MNQQIICLTRSYNVEYVVGDCTNFGTGRLADFNKGRQQRTLEVQGSREFSTSWNVTHLPGICFLCHICVFHVTSPNRYFNCKHWRLMWYVPCKTQINHNHNQCSRLKPSYEFHFEGLSNFSPSVEVLVQIQKYIEMKCKTHIKLAHELYDTFFLYNVKIKNQASNSTSCSDSAPCLLVLGMGRLY